MSNVYATSMTVSKRIATRILVLSDTHSALPELVNNPNLRFCQRFPDADVAIHCGDLTSCGRLEEHQRALQLLKSLPAPIKIVIPGNHDMTLDSEYLQNNRRLHGWKQAHLPKDFQESVDTYTSLEAQDAGIRYIVEGTHSFVLPNGAKLTVYASAYTPEFFNWGFAYPRSYDRYNRTKERVPANPIPDFASQSTGKQPYDGQIAVMITHGPPYGILDTTTRGDNVGCEHLMTAVSRCRPLLHCFGHIHEGWGVETRLWPGDAENGGIIGSEAAELRRPYDKRSIVEDDSLTGIQRYSQSTKVEGRTAQEAEDMTLSNQQSIRISHPVELSDTTNQSMTKESTTVSVVDATGLEHGKQTVFINASIMDVRYVPRQWPWLVLLSLPEASPAEIASS